MLGFAAMLAVCELVCRYVLGFGGDLFFDNHPVLGWEYRPHQRGLGARGMALATIDGDGGRRVVLSGAASVSAPADTTLRVAVLGNSLTFGTGVEDGAPWPSQLASMLQADVGDRGRRVSLRNQAVPGYRIEQMVRAYRLKLRSWEPDLLVLPVTERDFALMRPPRAERKTRIERWARRTALHDAFRAVGESLMPALPDDRPPDDIAGVERLFWTRLRAQIEAGSSRVLGARRGPLAVQSITEALARDWSDRDYSRLPDVLGAAFTSVDSSFEARGQLALELWRRFESGLEPEEWGLIRVEGGAGRLEGLWRIRALQIASLARELERHGGALLVVRLPVPGAGPRWTDWRDFGSESWVRELQEAAPNSLGVCDAAADFDPAVEPLRAFIKERGLLPAPDGEERLIPEGFEHGPRLLLDFDAFHYSRAGHALIAASVRAAVRELGPGTGPTDLARTPTTERGLVGDVLAAER